MLYTYDKSWFDFTYLFHYYAHEEVMAKRDFWFTQDEAIAYQKECELWSEW